MKGPPGIMSVEFIAAEVAQQVMKRLKLFTQATSLGGSMSLVDWRYAYVSPPLLLSLLSALSALSPLSQASQTRQDPTGRAAESVHWPGGP